MPDPDDFLEAVKCDIASLYESGISITLVRSYTPAIAEFAGVYLGFPKEPLWKSVVTVIIDAADGVEHSRLTTDGIIALYGIDLSDPLVNAPTVRVERRNQNAAPLLKKNGGASYASGETLRKAKINGQRFTDFVHELVATEIVRLACEREFAYTGQYAKPATADADTVEHHQPRMRRTAAPEAVDVTQSGSLSEPGTAQRADPAIGSSRQRPALRRRGVEVASLVGIALILLTGILYVIARTAGEAKVGLSKGAVVDAQNGRIVDHPDLRNDPPGNPGVEGGDILRVCNDSAGECDLSKWVAARPGDRIRFRFRIHNPMDNSLPYAKFFAHSNTSTGEHRNISVSLEIRWPAMDYSGQNMNSNTVPIRTLPSSKHIKRLRYAPKSTILANEKGERMAMLPDGLADGGVALANIGSPPSCYVCDLEYIRFVEFSMKAE